MNDIGLAQEGAPGLPATRRRVDDDKSGFGRQVAFLLVAAARVKSSSKALKPAGASPPPMA